MNHHTAKHLASLVDAAATTQIYTLSLHDALPISTPLHTPQQSLGDVAELPTVTFGHRSLMWWGTLGFMVDRKSTRLNSSHLGISYAVFCLKKNKKNQPSGKHP